MAAKGHSADGSKREKIRKRFMRRRLNVVSMYVSKYPPVDDYEHLLKAPYTPLETSQTNVTPILFAQGHEEEAFDQLNTLFQNGARHWHFRDAYEESEVQSLEQLVLTGAVQKEEKDRNLLEYGNPFSPTFLSLFKSPCFSCWR